MAKVYKSEAMAAVHEMMDGFQESGAIDKATMKSFDAMCLEPVAVLSAEDIKALRQKEAVSQPIFSTSRRT